MPCRYAALDAHAAVLIFRGLGQLNPAFCTGSGLDNYAFSVILPPHAPSHKRHWEGEDTEDEGPGPQGGSGAGDQGRGAGGGEGSARLGAGGMDLDGSQSSGSDGSSSGGAEPVGGEGGQGALGAGCSAAAMQRGVVGWSVDDGGTRGGWRAAPALAVTAADAASGQQQPQQAEVLQPPQLAGSAQVRQPGGALSLLPPPVAEHLRWRGVDVALVPLPTTAPTGAHMRGAVDSAPGVFSGPLWIGHAVPPARLVFMPREASGQQEEIATLPLVNAALHPPLPGCVRAGGGLGGSIEEEAAALGALPRQLCKALAVVAQGRGAVAVVPGNLRLSLRKALLLLPQRLLPPAHLMRPPAMRFGRVHVLGPGDWGAQAQGLGVTYLNSSSTSSFAPDYIIPPPLHTPLPVPVPMRPCGPSCARQACTLTSRHDFACAGCWRDGLACQGGAPGNSERVPGGVWVCARLHAAIWLPAQHCSHCRPLPAAGPASQLPTPASSAAAVGCAAAK